MENFNFDKWADLYRQDPFEFDRQRKVFLESVISSAPSHVQPTLRVLQDKCDKLHNSLTPIDALTEMSAMMLESSVKLHCKTVELDSIYKAHRSE